MKSDKGKFNNYCKEVMGYTRNCPTNYNPYADLNQMAEVVETLLHTCMTKDDDYFEACCFRIDKDYTVKQAFREFIISTMEEDK